MTSNKPPSVVPIYVCLAALEVVSDIQKPNAGPDHFARIILDDKIVIESEKKFNGAPVKWEWQNGHKFLFYPSSTVKIEIRRKSSAIGSYLVGRYKGEIVELLDNDATVHLKDGSRITAEMKIDLSLVDTDFKTLMEDVSTDVSRLGNSVQPPGGITALLGMAWSFTRSIMDNVADAHPILKTSWTIISYVYKAVQQVKVQDDAIRSLAERLQEVLGVANMKGKDLLRIEGTTDVIEEIGRASLTAVSLIHEYTTFSFSSRLLKSLLRGPTSRIVQCQQSFNELLEKFDRRVIIDVNDKAADIKRDVKTINDNAQVEKIKEWLKPPGSSINYNAARKAHQEGTSSWFFDGPWFRELQEKAGLLWIKGTTGCGKTILCSSVIARIRELDGTASGASNAYFFFDGRDEQTALQLHDMLIRSLVWQLSLQSDGSILTALAGLYRSCKNGSEEPMTNDLQDTLHTIITSLHSVFIIIDSLDECTTRDETLTWIRQINSFKMDNLHMVVTSRPERDISDVLESLDLRTVDLIQEPANDDVRKYLQRLPPRLEKWDKDTQDTVRSALTKGAGGMFRWAALQIMELEKCSSREALMQQLHNLPQGLTATYTKMLSKFDNERDRSDTTTFLRWLIFATRRMTLVELAETVVVDFSKNEPRYSESRRYRDPRDVLEKCSGLVIELEGRVTLAHVSVKEYLLSEDLHSGALTLNFHLSDELSHSFISQTCLAYLLQFNSLGQNMVESFPLAYYAADRWIFHAKQAGINKSKASSVLRLAVKLFSPNDPSLINWLKILQTMRFKQQTSGLAGPLYTPLSTGFVMSLEQSTLGSVGTSGGVDDNVNTQTEYLNSAFLAAIYLENEQITKLLLDNGADVNALGEDGNNALLDAIYRGDEALVKLLLDNGADISARNQFGKDALLYAISQKNERIVKLLLDHGANVDTQREDGDTALLDAILNREHEGIVKLLLANGADANSRRQNGSNTLFNAIFRGNEGIVKLLLDNGADVNFRQEDGTNTLLYAKSRGNEGIVKLLLDHGAKETSL